MPLHKVAFLIFAPLFFSNALGTPLDLEFGHALTWSTEEGKWYQVEGSQSADGPWTALTAKEAGDGESQSHYQPADSSYSHYRLAEEVPGGIVLPILAGNGGFEQSDGATIDSWTLGGNQPPTRSSSEAHRGSFSLRSQLQNIGGSTREGLVTSQSNPLGEPVVPGQEYRFFFWFKQVSAGTSYVQQYEVSWLDSEGSFLSSGGLNNFSAASSDWEEISQAGLVAPANAADVRIRFRFVTGAVNNDFGEVFIDDVGLDNGSPPETTPGATSHLPLTPTPVSRLSWTSANGVPYQARSTTDLQNWQDEGEELWGTGEPLTIDLPRVQPAEFFRLEYPDGSGPLLGNIVKLYDANTPLEPETTEETATALITRVADRVRDRHAREDQFQAYDHYLSWYWEERTLKLEIIDKVAKGGSEVVFNYETLTPLGAAEFRAFFLGQTTEAQYYSNQIAANIGPNQYTAKVTSYEPERRPLQIGDRIEIEISQFLAAPTNGRSNYYGTAILYIVGQGIVPWEGKGSLQDSFPLPESAWLGGETTLPYQYSNEPEHRFKQMAGNIAPMSAQPFMDGRRLHHTDFGDGSHSENGNPIFAAQVGKLGPAFTAKSCVACHANNGRALPPTLHTPLSQSRVLVSGTPLGLPHPTLGSVLQSQSTNGTGEGTVSISSYTETSHQYGDGSSYTLRKPNYAFQGAAPEHHSVRIAPQLVGLGLLEAIDESSLIALADPEDSNNDGISGRAQVVTDPETGETRLGRFTNKAGKARLSHQIAAAFNQDMGVTTAAFPLLDGESTASQAVEIDESKLAQLTRYIALLGVGARRDLENPQAIAGEQAFNNIGCASCHTPIHITGSFHPFTELRNQTIRPFTDLLLHDMGSGLADSMGEGGASGSEWRTPPLWGIGLTAGVSGGESYLHDGRARSLEEAILWHGGEGESSKEAFRNLPAADRDALVIFLKSL